MAKMGSVLIQGSAAFMPLQAYRSPCSLKRAEDRAPWQIRILPKNEMTETIVWIMLRRVFAGSSGAAEPEGRGRAVRRRTVEHRMNLVVAGFKAWRHWRRNRFRRCAQRLCYAGVLAIRLAATAAEDPVTPLSDVLHDGNKDSIPDLLGETFTVAGVLASDPEHLNIHGRAYATLAYLEDATGGIALFTKDASILPERLRRGDVVRVRGT